MKYIKVDAKGNTAAYYYELAGRKIAEVSPNNYDSTKTLQNLSRTEYNYDLMDRVKTKVSVYFDKVSSSFVTITSAAFKYDNNGNVVKELDAVGYEAGTGSTIDDKISFGYGKIYSYNLANKLLTILDADSQDRLLPYSKRYTYDGTGRKITETDGKGKVTTWYYDDANNITKTTIKRLASEAEVTVSSATYNSTGDVITATDGNGNITTYEYTGFGKVKKVTYPGDSTIAAYYVIYQYDTVGRVIRKQDSVGVASIYTYDSAGRELTSTEENVDGTEAIEVATTYDKNGNKRFLTDGNGVVTENVYDELNKLVTSTIYVTDGSGNKVKHTTSYIYDKNNNLLKEIDWLGNEKTYVYDALDRVVEKYDQNNKLIQKLEYYHNGTQSKSYDALQNVTLYYYDKNNRLIKTVDSEGHITLQHYDEVGNIDQKTDGDNNTTYYSYDQYNRLVSVKNAKGEITNYTYDLNGNMLTEVDAQGNITTFEYNVANKLIRKIFHGGRTGSSGSYTYDPSKTESYTYYANSDLRTKVDRNGVTSTYTYDIHGRKTSETIGSITNSFGYDNNGNQIRITDATGTTTRTYDELNRVTSKSVPTVGTIVYKYNIVSGIVGLDSGNFGESETDPKGNVTLKIYDKAGRIKKVIAGDDATTYNYYDNGSLNSVVYPNGYSEEYTYYKDKLLRTLVNKASNGTVIESYSYTYDNANNMLSKTDNKGTTSYTYDELNRLKTVTEPSGKVTTYTYTSAGNRNTETVVEGSNTTVKTYTYDALNRLLSIITSLNTVTVENTAYTYDNNGNQLTSRVDSYVNGLLQSSSVTSNVYDSLNQLIKTTTPDNTTIKNIYNGEGLRVEKQVGDSSTKYLYSSDKVVLELDGNGNLIARNIYGINLLERITDSKKAYYLYNGHADTTKLIAQDGTGLNSYYYDAFGNITESNENMDNPYRYAGYQYDKETKTYYVVARMYDPSTGRFLQEDSYSGDIKDPLSLNLYVYVNNNPMTYDDPNGHWPSFINNFVSTVSSAASSAWSYVKEKASDFYSWGKKEVSNISKAYNTVKAAYKVSNYVYKNVVKPELKKQDEEIKKRIYDKVSDFVKKVDYNKLISGITSVGLGAASIAGGAALMVVPGAQGFGAAFIASGTGSVVYGGGEILESTAHINPIRDFAVNKVGISSDTYDLLGAGITATSGFGLGAFAAESKLESITDKVNTEQEFETYNNELNNSKMKIENPKYSGLKPVTKGAGNPERQLLSGSEWNNYFKEAYGAENVSLKGTDPADFLNSALSIQGLNTAPAKLKETWIQGGYKYEVRIHPAEAEYGKTNSIYRVSRQNVEIPTGVEYMGTDGNWYHTSVLKPGKNGNINANFNNEAAEMTHIQLP